MVSFRRSVGADDFEAVREAAIGADDHAIADPEAAYLGAAKLMAMTVIDLLASGAARATDILANSKPRMTKDEYLAFMRSMFRDELYEG